MTKSKSIVREGTHKCLLYWHHVGGGSIPMGKDAKGERLRMLVRGGYNTFDSDHLQGIVDECRDVIAAGILTFWGIKVDTDGKAKEINYLSDISASELREIIEQTTNADTLADLGNPDVVGVKNQDFAARRMDELDKATGLEPDNLDIVEEKR